jgi:xanthine dehydrogenase accessory factor
VKDVLAAVERWSAEGLRVAVATVVEREGSAPRDPGATLAVSERGEVAGSVTGGCVEPAVYEEALEVLRGGSPRLCTYGIADEEAFEVGLACGGTVRIFVEPVEPAVLEPLRAAIEVERPIALVTTVRGAEPGGMRVVEPAEGEPRLVEEKGELIFVSPFLPRPRMLVLGAVDHAEAVARIARFLGYRVTVCDARARFATAERFPEVDELVVAWPDAYLRSTPRDRWTAIVVLTHDPKFDVPALVEALRTDAVYIGAMGSRRTTEERAARLRAAGVSKKELARLHAPIGLPIGGRSPEEVAVAIVAELVQATRGRARDTRKESLAA